MAGRRRVGVLALQGGVREHLVALTDVGADAVPIRRPADLESVAGLVLPGGESGVIERLLRLFGMREPLRAAIAQGLPVLGTCAGLILLADRIENPAPGQESIGGLDVTVRRNAFGGQRESFDTVVDVAGIDDSLEASFIRAPEIVAVGHGAEVIATLPDGRIVGARSRAITGVSFHPELTGERRLHADFVATLGR